jgi:hypothetical protein
LDRRLPLRLVRNTRPEPDEPPTLRRLVAALEMRLVKGVAQSDGPLTGEIISL